MSAPDRSTPSPGLPVSIPNIPPRSGTASTSAAGPRSLSASHRPASVSRPGSISPSASASASRPARPTAKQSTEGLGKKILAPVPTRSEAARSNLTAQLGSSPVPPPASGPGDLPPPPPAPTAATAGPAPDNSAGADANVSRRSSTNALRPTIPHRRSGNTSPNTPQASLSPSVPPVPSAGNASLTQATPSLTPTPGGGGGDSSFSNIADIPEHDKMRILRRHLVSAEERGSASRGATPREGSPLERYTPAGTPGAVENGNGHAGASGRGGANGGRRSRRASMANRGKGKDKDKSRDTTPGKNRSAEGASGSDEEGVNGNGDGYGYNAAGESGYGSIQDEEHFPIPYDAPGMDVTHDLYKWQQDHRPGPQRSASFSHIPLDRSTILDPTLAHIKEPGGFRRNFVVTRAQEQGLEPPSVVRNVVDFLFLYGHFAGEDLDEDEDESDSDLDDLPTASQLESGLPANQIYARQPFSRDALERPLGLGRDGDGERQPLLNGHAGGSAGRPGTMSRGVSRSRHRRQRSGPGGGTASFTQAVLMLLKGFVGTGILFMAKAFFNGGLLFSTLVLLGIAAISLWAFLLLTQTYLVVPGSFGAYTIFIAENLQAFVLAVTDCKTFIATRWLIFAQLVLFLPLAMIRNLAKLSGTALVADAFILIGLVYILTNESIVLAAKGVADVAMFNPTNFPLFIGTAVFTFEGIGLVIPITESMREPQRFPKALTGVMFVISILFAVAGIMGYAAYGSKVQTVVIVNLPQEDKFVQAVQFLYSIAILLSTPLQLFPAVRIMENGLFSRSGKHNTKVKWQKNIFRGATVVGCSLISWAGSKELDKFVALIGSFACIPLCFIYPPLLHLKACAKTRTAKALDILLLLFGVGICLYTTEQTIRSLFGPDGPPPVYGKCEVPRDA